MKRIERVYAGLWMLLMLVVAVSRLADLGIRAMSHDESLHAYYSWQFATTGTYRHDPMMHGPLLFHINAGIFVLFGDTDATARLAPALAGIGLALACLLFRRRLGRLTAWLAAVMIAIAPDILFYSRYIRNDIYIALLLLLWVHAMFRYLEEPRPLWLLMISAVMALSFACKEVSFIHVAIFTAFLTLRIAWSAFSRRELDVSCADLAIFMSALVAPFACPLLHHVLGWDPLDNQSAAGRNQTYSLAGMLALAGMGVSSLWLRLRRRFCREERPGFLVWGGSLLLFWLMTITLFTSLFTNTLPGLATGLAGSLGYWLAQHGVQRGNQPVYYYLMLMLLYNPALLLASVVALPSCLRNKENLFARFLVFWFLASFAAYTIAGERMPWLLVHITLPMTLLAAIYLASLLQTPSILCPASLVVASLPLVSLYMLLHVPSAAFRSGLDIESVQSSMNWIRFGLGAVISAGIIFRLSRPLPAPRGKSLMLGLMAALFLQTGHNAFRLTFINHDLATEHLVFAHGTDRIKPLCRLIERTQRAQSNPKAIVAAYDQESAWPLTWYLRNVPHRYFLEPDITLLNVPIILAGNTQAPVLRDILDDAYTSSTFPMVWWPLQGYMDMTPARLADVLASPSERRALWNIIRYRRYDAHFDQWPLRHDLTAFVRRNLDDRIEEPLLRPDAAAAAALDAPVFGPYQPRAPARILSGPYDGKPLREPRAVSRAPDRRLAIADTGNNRIILLDSQGSFLRALQPDPPLSEPWGIACNDHRIYVADTWNGKIRRFNWDGTEMDQWGRFALTAAIRDNPHNLYGPRGLSLDPAGNLLVADTGNKRILLFDSTGRHLRSFGPFNEPVNGVFLPGTERLAVSDVWNRRIAIVGPDSGEVKAIPAPYWNYLDMPYKPSVAADAQRRLFAAIPDRSCILVHDADGAPLGHFGLYGFSPDRMNQPCGLFYDPVADQLLVADSGNNRILIFDVGGEPVKP